MASDSFAKQMENFLPFFFFFNCEAFGGIFLLCVSVFSLLVTLCFFD